MKRVVGIFAHPDDEALGPAGTIAKFASEGDVYLICVTCGEAGGKTSDEKEKIGSIRRSEMQESAKLLGVKEVFFLHFEDGTLSNSLYQQIANKIKEKLDALQPDTIMTFEPRGVSGHLDHIAVSMITTHLFYKLSFIKKLMYYCLSEKRRAKVGDYFVYFPPGYKDSEIQEVVDIEDHWDIKVRAMHCHESQMHDVQNVLKQSRDLPKKECFLVLEK
jgi:LmbE family N-acetylglucosaminyl deacetylase